MSNRVVLWIADAALGAIVDAAAAAYPEECCGVLLGTSDEDSETRVARVVPVENGETDERRRRYRIDAETILSVAEDAERRGLSIVGFYHSHPDHPAAPSPTDLELAWPWYRYVIVPVAQGTPGAPRVWCLAHDRTAFVEGRLARVREQHTTTRNPL